MAVITLDRVGKRYGRTTAVRDLSLSVERGEMFGLIGPDGAGKTTTIRLICGLLPADTGYADAVPQGCFQTEDEARAAGWSR